MRRPYKHGGLEFLGTPTSCQSHSLILSTVTLSHYAFGNEDLDVGFQRKIVGHAGDVIADELVEIFIGL